MLCWGSVRSAKRNSTQVLIKFHEYYAPVLELSLSTTTSLLHHYSTSPPYSVHQYVSIFWLEYLGRVISPRHWLPRPRALEDIQKLTQLEHVLLRPDTYIGSTEMNHTKLWVYDADVGLNQKDVTYVPGPLSPPTTCRVVCFPMYLSCTCRYMPDHFNLNSPAHFFWRNPCQCCRQQATRQSSDSLCPFIQARKNWRPDPRVDETGVPKSRCPQTSSPCLPLGQSRQASRWNKARSKLHDLCPNPPASEPQNCYVRSDRRVHKKWSCWWRQNTWTL
jgi:hypothetical protein